MRTGDAPGEAVHRSAKADAEGASLGVVEGLGEPEFDLPADAISTCMAIDGVPPAAPDGSVGLAGNELEFGAADFEGEQLRGGKGHGPIEPRERGATEWRSARERDETLPGWGASGGS